MSFIHRFRASLNRHIHFYCCIIAGVFDTAPGDGEAERFRPAAALTAEVLAAITEQVPVEGCVGSPAAL